MPNSRFRTHLVVRQRRRDEPQKKAAPAKQNNTSRDVMLESTVDRSSRQGSWADFYSRNSGGSGLRTSGHKFGPISNRFGETPEISNYIHRKRVGASLQCVGLGLASPHAGSRPIFIARVAAKNSRAARHSGACGGHEERLATLKGLGRRAHRQGEGYRCR